MNVRAFAATIAAATILLAGCGPGSPSVVPGDPTPTPRADAPTASVTPLDPTVSVTAGGTGQPVPVRATADLAEGDTVSTDPAGLAEIAFDDGSLTRVGPSTELVVTALGDVDTTRVALRLEVGSTWHRVQRAVGEEARFEVETPVGVAAVRGTTFVVECAEDRTCRFTVYEGRLEVTPTDGEPILVGTLERLHLPGDAERSPAAEPLPVDRVLEEDWSARNLERDGTTQEVLDGATPRNARISGAWITEFLVEETTNLGISWPGREFVREWTLSSEPCDGLTCPTGITSASGWTGRLRHLGDALVSIPAVDAADCLDIATGDVRVPGAFEQRSHYELRIVDAEVVDGVLTATRIEGVNELHLSLLDAHRAACGAEIEDSTEISTVTMLRPGPAADGD